MFSKHFKKDEWLTTKFYMLKLYEEKGIKVSEKLFCDRQIPVPFGIRSAIKPKKSDSVHLREVCSFLFDEEPYAITEVRVNSANSGSDYLFEMTQRDRFLLGSERIIVRKNFSKIGHRLAAKFKESKKVLDYRGVETVRNWMKYEILGRKVYPMDVRLIYINPYYIVFLNAYANANKAFVNKYQNTFITNTSVERLVESINNNFRYIPICDEVLNRLIKTYGRFEHIDVIAFDQESQVPDLVEIDDEFFKEHDNLKEISKMMLKPNIKYYSDYGIRPSGKPVIAKNVLLGLPSGHPMTSLYNVILTSYYYLLGVYRENLCLRHQPFINFYKDVIRDDHKDVKILAGGDGITVFYTKRIFLPSTSGPYSFKPDDEFLGFHISKIKDFIDEAKRCGDKIESIKSRLNDSLWIPNKTTPLNSFMNHEKPLDKKIGPWSLRKAPNKALDDQLLNAKASGTSSLLIKARNLAAPTIDDMPSDFSDESDKAKERSRWDPNFKDSRSYNAYHKIPSSSIDYSRLIIDDTNYF